MVQPSEVLAFWRDAGQEQWFAKVDAFDAKFRSRFLDAHFAAARREYDDWLGNAEDALSLILLLDQFPRNCFRGTGHMFATDGLCRTYAREALELGYPQQVAEELRVFFYLPFMHSEELEDQKLCCELCKPLGDYIFERAVEHYDIIERFNRFAHRNEALGRQTTPEEKAFLDDGGFAG